VVTTGGSVIKATIERAKEDGLNIYGVIVLVDREEFNGMEKIKESVADIPEDRIISIVTRSDIMKLYNNKGSSSDLKFKTIL